jgi:stalled ribosome alternative rescue factor ArfA
MKLFLNLDKRYYFEKSRKGYTSYERYCKPWGEGYNGDKLFKNESSSYKGEVLYCPFL